MNRWKVILAAALIFAMGMATGAWSLRLFFFSRAPVPSRQGWVPYGVLDTRYNLLGKMKDQLKLSEDQEKRIDVILQDGRKRMRTAWESFHPTVREETKGVYSRISAELSEAQRGQWEEMLKKSRERRGPRPDGEPKSPGKRGERGTNNAAASPPQPQPQPQPPTTSQAPAQPISQPGR